MKLSKETIDILKNFSSINMSMLFREGNKLKTVDASKAIMAIANISETIPREFAVYDLNQFIGLMSLFQDPELKLGERAVQIHDKTDTASFTYSPKEAIVAASDKEINFPMADVEFSLNRDTLTRALRAAGVLAVEHVAIIGKNGKSYLAALNATDPTSHVWETVVGKSDSNYRMVFLLANIKVLPRDYNVTVSMKGISKFASTTGDVVYYIATESSSKLDS